jgi:hypothetical protein
MDLKSKAAVAALKAEAADTIVVDQQMMSKAGAAKMSAGHCGYHVKSFFILHSAGLALAGGILVGIAVHRLFTRSA